MNLLSVIEIYSGGPGSGCNPDKGKCGRPKGSGKGGDSRDRQHKEWEAHRAMSDYSQLSHEQVNKWLRKGMPKPKTISERDSVELVRGLDYAFQSPKLYKVFDRPGMLYRGIDSPQLYRSLKRGGAKRGRVLQDKAFVSTTQRPAIAEEAAGYFHSDTPVLLDIEVPKGTRYLTPGSLTHKGEAERLLNRGSRFKILRHTQEGPAIRLRVKLLS